VLYEVKLQLLLQVDGQRHLRGVTGRGEHIPGSAWEGRKRRVYFIKSFSVRLAREKMR